MYKRLHRSRYGRCPLRRPRRSLDHEPRYGRPNELQPGDRRRCQRSPRSRDRRVRRNHGAGDRCHRDPVSYAERSQRPRDAQPPRSGGQKGYQNWVKFAVEQQENLDLRQEVVLDLLTEKVDGREKIVGVKVLGDVEYRAAAVILTTGTFLSALMHTGEAKTKGGRAGEGTTTGISSALDRLGFRLQRFKTGTPPRLNSRTIDYDKAEIQPGDEIPKPFSFMTDRIELEQLPCWITYTNSAVHDLIRANLDRAPMYSGQIQGSGPRYCPSIEDKIVKFADKDRHQLFLEPEGRQTHEVYVNGVSTSLPRDVQDQMFKLIPGLENAQIMRYGYAVEYDFCPPDQLRNTLETKSVDGLYFCLLYTSPSPRD